MCAGTLVHIPKYMGQTSNNNRMLLIIRRIILQFGVYELRYSDMRHKVYI